MGFNFSIGPNAIATKTIWHYQRELPITALTQASPTVITTTGNHGLNTNDWAVVLETDSFPNADNGYQITRITGNTLSVPFNVSLHAGTKGRLLIPTNFSGRTWTGTISAANQAAFATTTAKAQTKSGSRHVFLYAEMPGNFEFKTGQYLTVEGAINSSLILDVGQIDSVFPGGLYKQGVYVQDAATASLEDGRASASSSGGVAQPLSIVATSSIGRLDVTFPALPPGKYDFSIYYSVSGGANALLFCDQLTVEC